MSLLICDCARSRWNRLPHLRCASQFDRRRRQPEVGAVRQRIRSAQSCLPEVAALSQMSPGAYLYVWHNPVIPSSYPTLPLSRALPSRFDTDSPAQ